jgi:hypothetical protein
MDCSLNWCLQFKVFEKGLLVDWLSCHSSPHLLIRQLLLFRTWFNIFLFEDCWRSILQSAWSAYVTWCKEYVYELLQNSLNVLRIWTIHSLQCKNCSIGKWFVYSWYLIKLQIEFLISCGISLEHKGYIKCVYKDCATTIKVCLDFCWSAVKFTFTEGELN